MTKEKLKNSYRSLKDAAMSDWHLGDTLDNHLKTGYNIVRIDHDSAAAAGLPLDICSREHYIVGHLFVSESGTDDKLQRGRTIGQVLLVNSCNGFTADIFRRLGNYHNGNCHWNAWARVTDIEGGGVEFISRLQGIDSSSNASRDPFKFLGEFGDPNSEELHAALNNLHSTTKADGYEGVWRFTVAGKPSVLYNFAMSYPQDKWLQGLITVYTPYSDSDDYVFTINNKMNVLYRTFSNGAWSEWKSITGEYAKIADLNNEITRAESAESEIKNRIQGISVNSDASRDPFKFLGEFSDPNSEELHAALNNLHSTTKADGYEGVWRFTVAGKPSVLYNFAMSYPQDKWLQGLITVYTPYSGSGDYVFTINNKMNVLHRTFSNGAWSEWKNSVSDFDVELGRVGTELKKVVKKRNFVKIVGNEAYIISKYDANYDIVFSFSKTMLNELYGLKKVYLAHNSNADLSTDHTRPEAVSLANQVSSDMIGPMSVSTGDDLSWIGGNHLYFNQNSGVRSASTDRFTIYADGKEITAGEVYADEVVVKVENTLYDPNVAPAAGETVLSSPLVKENVAYTVDSGEITVGLEHRYLKDIYVGVYYGMQSMFVSGTHFITADGGFSDWQSNPASGSVSILKSSSPEFNRFSQKNANGYYQNTVLFNTGLGNHELLNDDDKIFIWSATKAYHVLISKRNITNGTVLSWMGAYNWNKPVIDDANNYVYAYRDNTTDYLSLTAKKAYRNVAVALPSKMQNNNFIATTGSIAVGESSASNIVLTATAAGSAIVTPSVVCDNSITAQKLSSDIRSKVENPLRSLYIAAGATYNAVTGFYELNGVNDLTESDIMNSYIYKDVIYRLHIPRVLQGASIRAIYPYMGHKNLGDVFMNTPLSGYCTFTSAKLEILRFANSSYLSINSVVPAEMPSAANVKWDSTFLNCYNLREIWPIDVRKVPTFAATAFKGCTSLIELRLFGVSNSLVLSECSNISKESVLYIIANSQSTAAMTITLHSDAYARLADDADIVAALEAQPLVSLVCA